MLHLGSAITSWLRRAKWTLILLVAAGAVATLSGRQSDFEGASQQFGLALQLQPQDANVEANLGAALAELGRFPEAKSHFERALQIDPNQPIAKYNLDRLQKEMNSR